MARNHTAATDPILHTFYCPCSHGPFPQVSHTKLLARQRSRRPRRQATGRPRSGQERPVQAGELLDDRRRPRTAHSHERPPAIRHGRRPRTIMPRAPHRIAGRCNPVRGRIPVASQGIVPGMYQGQPDPHRDRQYHQSAEQPSQKMPTCRAPCGRRRNSTATPRDAQPRSPNPRHPPPHRYHSPNVHTGPQPPERCRADLKCSLISRERCASSDARVGRLRQGCATAGAPASSSSQRGQPGVFRPHAGPPQVCFVVVITAP